MNRSRKIGFVVIEVGQNRKQYHVHKAVLVKHSEYFQNALNGPWKEASQRLVSLTDVEPDGFAVFIGWLYTLTLPKRDEWASIDSESTLGR
jgi:hypothetical protein